MTMLALSFAQVQDAFAAWGDRAVLYLPLVLLGLGVFLVFLLVAGVVAKLAERSLTRTARDPRAGTAWGTIVRYAVVVVGLVASLAVAGVDLGAMMVAVGALAFGLAFAMQDIIANLASGLILLTTHPFASGDAVQVAGIGGKVEEIGMRSTKMRTWEGLRVEVPNKEVLSNPITVYTYYPDRRVDVIAGISYDDNIPAAVETARRAVKGIDDVLDEPAPEVLIDELAGSSVNLRVRFWVDTRPGRTSWVTIKGEVTRTVKEALDAGGFDIPFPIRTVYMHEANGGAAGSSKPQQPNR